MKFNLYRSRILFVMVIPLTLFSANTARADYTQRFSLGVGIVTFSNSSQTDLEVGAEYEYRVDSYVGLGGFGSYIFSTPGITELGLPEVFFHPLAGEWYVSAAPIIEFGSGITTEVGARIGTRVPIPLGGLTLIPSVAVDFIAGGQSFIFGLGLQF